MKPPVLIELDLLVDEAGEVHPELLPRLAEFNQAGQSLVLLAARPDTWRPTRSTMDTALGRQGHITSAIKQAGGTLDATLYLDFGLFTRRARRTGALENLAGRYDCQIRELRLIARSARLAEAVEAAGGRVQKVDDKRRLDDHLRDLISHK